MDFRFTPEEESFRQEVKAFLTRELPPGFREPVWLDGFYDNDESWSLHRAMARKAGARGWLSLTWPRQYGGQEASVIRQLILWEEFFYHRAPGLDIMGVKMLSPVLLHFASEEQKQRFLLPIGRGEVMWCQGYSEPNAGSDLAGVQTRAVEAPGGFLVNGQKIWTSGAHRADWMFLLCRTDPQAPKHQGLSFLLLDMKTPGVTPRPLVNILGARSFNEVFLDNVLVPRENLVGVPGQGWQIATALLNYERSGVERLGGARRLLDDLLQFAREKGGLSPQLHQRLAEAAVEAEVGRLFAYRVGWMLGRGLAPQAEASIAKVYITELLARLANLGSQLLGLSCQLEGDGAPLNGVVGRWYLTCLGGTIAAGTSEIQRNLISQRGLGLPRG